MHTNNYSKNKKLELLISKFIKKVINDNKNYNIIKNISNKNINNQNINNQNIKLVNIFLENNNINKISTENLIINYNFEDSINNLLHTKSILEKYLLKKILYFNFNINENNLHELLIINDSSNNNSSNNKIYNINFINFDIINKNVVLDKNNNIDNIIFSNDSLFFIQDLNCIYLIFEKNLNDEIFINKSKIINIKTKNIKTKNIKTKNIKTKNINNKIKSINKTKKIINIK
jgi:hypothetical protein